MCESVHCERVRKSCRRTREREREREICVAQGPSRPPPRLDRVLLLHHHLLAAGPCSGTPPDILGPPFSPPRPILSHPMVSPLFSPTYLYPPYPLARPVSAGQPSVAAGRLLFVDTATPVHQMVGRWICVCVSVCFYVFMFLKYTFEVKKYCFVKQ